MTPSTTAGRLLCIFYALFGIPLSILFLQSIGEEILKGQRNVLTKMEVHVLRRGEPSYLSEKCFVVSLLFIIVVICIGAGAQESLEGWSFLEGVYCYFITFSTIGFGDLIPGERRRTVMRILRPFYVILGLVVMSNVVNALIGCAKKVKAAKNLCICERKEIEESGITDSNNKMTYV